MGRPECNSCPGVALIEPDISESGLVCPNCGRFQKTSDITYNGLAANEGQSYHNPNLRLVMAGNKMRHAVQDKNCYQSSMLQGFIEELEPVVQKYTNESSTRNKIVEMFAKICFTTLRGFHFKTKMRYLMACTLIGLRDAGIQVLLMHLCDDFNLEFRGAIKIVSEMATRFKHLRKPDTYAREMQKLINSYPAIKQDGLADKLPKILDLLDACSFSIGRDRTIVAAHVAYLAVISKDDSTMDRIPFKKFLADNKIHLKRGQMKNLAERLIILIRKLPTVPADTVINFRNFHIFLKSAINFHKFIVHRMIEDDEEAEANDPPAEAAAVDPSGLPPTPLLQTPRGYAKAYRVQMKRRREACAGEDEERVDKKLKIAPNSEELTEDDLLGEKIDEFVLTEQQVEYRQRQIDSELL